MVALTDRLDYIVGAKAAGPLDEVFGIRTVDDLLRHYPRSYVEGTTVRGADDEPPQKGEHITLVDTITSAVTRPMKKNPRKKRSLPDHRRHRTRQVDRHVLSTPATSARGSLKTRG